MLDDRFRALRKEVDEVLSANPHLSADDAFVVWFVRGFLTADMQLALAALTGGAGDKSADAIYIDAKLAVVSIVQGKYQTGVKPAPAKRPDILALAHTGRSLLHENSASFDALISKAG